MILITTSKVITKRSENAFSRMFCNALDNIIYILNDPCTAWVRNPLESPMSQCVTSRSTQFESRKNGPREKWSPKNWSRKTQEQKIVGWASSIVVCVCEMLGCDQFMKTQNSTTNPKFGNEKSSGERQASCCVCVCVECSMWSVYENPKFDNKPYWTPLMFYSLVRWTSNIFLCV